CDDDEDQADQHRRGRARQKVEFAPMFEHAPLLPRGREPIKAINGVHRVFDWRLLPTASRSRSAIHVAKFTNQTVGNWYHAPTLSVVRTDKSPKSAIGTTIAC